MPSHENRFLNKAIKDFTCKYVWLVLKKCVFMPMRESTTSAVGLCSNPSCVSFSCKQEVFSVPWELIFKELWDLRVSEWGESCTLTLNQSPGLSLPKGLKPVLVGDRETSRIIIYSDKLFTWSSSILGLTCISWIRYFALGKQKYLLDLNRTLN